MATKRLSKSAVNWTKFSTGLPASEKELFRTLKGRSITFTQRIQSYPETLPKIDWQHYQSRVALPGLVDKFKKAYDTLQVPYPKDRENLTGQIEKDGDKLAKDVTFANSSLKDQVKLSKEFMDAIDKYLPDPLSTTADELIEFFPHEKMDHDKPVRWPFTPQAQVGMVKHEAP